MPEIELSAGTIQYEDTAGDGPAIVLLMDASLWHDVVARLSGDRRCIAPTLPLGAHRYPMRSDADLSPRGINRLVPELLERLDLEDVTLVDNDTGGAIAQLIDGEQPARIGQIVLVSCDAFDNLPPGLIGRTLVATGMLPPRFEIADSYTLVPLDQPTALADAIDHFVRQSQVSVA